MNKPYEVIELLESNNSRLFKEDVIEKEVLANNVDFFTGARLALDPMTTFGVKRVPETPNDGPGLSLVEFTQLATDLSKRILTGDAAHDAITAAREKATRNEWNFWYRRILIKDLRCGASEKTINKAAKTRKDFQIPVFTVQLAHDSANHEEKVKGKKLLEIKLDGVRLITIVHPNGDVFQCSRNGKEMVNFPHIKDQFSAIAGELTEPMVFDGEIMSASFQDLMRQMQRKSNVQTKDAMLNLFDMLPLKEFLAGKGKVNQRDRSNNLIAWFEDKMFLKLVNVTVLKHVEVDLDTPEGQAVFKEYNRKAIAGGYEGLLIKDPEAVYVSKRTVAWLKIKPFIEVSLTIVGIEEGTGKNAGKLGAFIMEGVDDGKKIKCNVGGGFSDKQREDYFTNKVIGDVGEVRADALTQNQDSEDTWSLRFPRFRTFRGFKHGEKF